MIEKQEPFKDRLNRAMTIRNIRAVDLCKRTGLSDGTISQYRSGYAEPKADKLQLIADALKVNPVWLMGIDVPMEMQKADLSTNNAETLAMFMQDERFFEYMKKASALELGQKEVLYNYIDFLLSSNH